MGYDPPWRRVTLTSFVGLHPSCRAQYDEWTKVWPLTTRIPRIDDTRSCERFTNTELDAMVRYMELAIQQATRAAHAHQVYTSLMLMMLPSSRWRSLIADIDISCFCAKLPIGAVVVNPTTGVVIAQAHDHRRCTIESLAPAISSPDACHPLNHTAMVLINQVALCEQSVRGHDTDADADNAVSYLCTGYDLYITREPCLMYDMPAHAHTAFFSTLI